MTIRSLAMALVAGGWAAGGLAAGEPYPELKLEGGFDNAQVNGVRVEEATAASPRVVIAGDQAAEGMPEKGRDPNRFLHWHFRLTGCQGRTVRFELYHARANPWTAWTRVPVVRYADGRIELMRGATVKDYGPAVNAKGEPIPRMQKLGIFFSHRFRDEPAEVAYAMPFGNDDIAALATELKGNPAVVVNELGKTPVFSLPLYQFVVTDPAVPDQDKKGVWLYAGEDPWEMPGMYGLAGFVRFVAGDDPLACEFRRKFVLSAIPHVNPDALRRGDTNFYLDDGKLINTGLSWKRTDLPANELIKAAMQKWKDAGRAVDLMTTMHSSCFWTTVVRIDWAYDQAVAQKFIDEVFAKKYFPWAAGTGMAKAADMSGTLGASLAATLWPDRLLFFGQHLEQIVMPKRELLGLPKGNYPADLPTDFLRLQRDDLATQGELFARAVAEFYGVTVPPEQVPPYLLAGNVDQYAGKAGEPRTYSVLYRDLAGREPKFVKLTVGKQTVEMKRVAGKDTVNGLLFEAAVPLAAGDNAFSFATDNGAKTIRCPKAGALLGPYVAE